MNAQLASLVCRSSTAFYDHHNNRLCKRIFLELTFWKQRSAKITVVWKSRLRLNAGGSCLRSCTWIVAFPICREHQRAPSQQTKQRCKSWLTRQDIGCRMSGTPLTPATNHRSGHDGDDRSKHFHEFQLTGLQAMALPQRMRRTKVTWCIVVLVIY